MLATKILYIHGRASSSKTRKATHLAQYFNVKCLDMETKNLEHDRKLQEQQIKEFEPDVVIGSSYGGAIAVTMLQKGTWRGPTILLAQAFAAYHKNDKNSLWLPENVPIILIHGKKDDIVDIEGSRILATTGSKGKVELIEVDDEHRLEGTIENGVLVDAVKRITTTCS
jgi:predicted esterase